mmetsp:Transcript_69527/g.185445  ORF Transcript_69527/g.185445 Transcript_69527/m.185445 type:complete len:213 (+) Transcript_69527:392-1030(+)
MYVRVPPSRHEFLEPVIIALSGLGSGRSRQHRAASKARRRQGGRRRGKPVHLAPAGGVLRRAHGHGWGDAESHRLLGPRCACGRARAFCAGWAGGRGRQPRVAGHLRAVACAGPGRWRVRVRVAGVGPVSMVGKILFFLVVSGVIAINSAAQAARHRISEVQGDVVFVLGAISVRCPKALLFRRLLYALDQQRGGSARRSLGPARQPEGCGG